MPVTESEAIKVWLLEQDMVFCRQVAKAVGEDGMKQLAANFKSDGRFFEAAKCQWSEFGFATSSAEAEVALREILLLIEEHKKSGRELADAPQLEYDLNGKSVR